MYNFNYFSKIFTNSRFRFPTFYILTVNAITKYSKLGVAMKKYSILSILPIIIQSQIYSYENNSRSMTRLNHRVLQYLHSVSDSTDEIHSKAFDSILEDLQSYARIGTKEYSNSMLQITNIRNGLYAKRNELYANSKNLTKFLWFFGKHPNFIVQQIDPAIKLVNQTAQSMYLESVLQAASNAGYIAQQIALYSTVVLAGAAMGYLYNQRNNYIPHPN